MQPNFLWSIVIYIIITIRILHETIKGMLSGFILQAILYFLK